MNQDDLSYVLFYEDVQEGQELPSFQRVTTIESWNRYAAAKDEFIIFHQDDDEGRAQGERGAFGMGNVRYAYLHDMLRGWIGLQGEIRRVHVQHRAINNKGDLLTAWGKVTRKYVEEGRHLIDLEIGVTNQDRVLATPGTATVQLPSRTG